MSMATGFPDAVADADDSLVRFVYLVLADADGWTTDEELREQTALSQPSVSRCARHLAEADLALRRRRPEDARLIETRLTTPDERVDDEEDDDSFASRPPGARDGSGKLEGER